MQYSCAFKSSKDILDVRAKRSSLHSAVKPELSDELSE